MRKFIESESTRRIVWNALHEIADDTVRQAALDAFQAVVSRLSFVEAEIARDGRRDTERMLPAVRPVSEYPCALVKVPDEISFDDRDGHRVKVST